MKKTLRILEELTYRMQQESRDPECLVWEQEAEALEAAFRKSHAGNRRLIHQVNDLLDAKGKLAERQSELRFFWGLQMGLEVGSLDLL